MNAAATIDKIREFTDKAVLIDDGYEPARLEMIQDNNWAQLREAEDLELWAPIRERYFTEIARPVELKKNPEALKEAWELYFHNPEQFRVFDLIFAHVLASKNADLLPLKSLVEYLREEVKLDVICHPDIASAAEDIKGCKLVFLDFFLYQKDPKKIIENAAGFGDLFRRPVSDGSATHGRFVYLISTSLPSSEWLEEFRFNTKLKSAFFIPVAKSLLKKEWLERELESKIVSYPNMWRLSRYLDAFSEQIESVSTHLQGEIASLEIHDLGILDGMRLEKDSEELGDYVTWLLSEAFAAKIRAAAPLLRAAKSISEMKKPAFQGSLKPKPILFDLFSEIAFATGNLGCHDGKARFGDVFFSKIAPNTSISSLSEAGGILDQKERTGRIFEERADLSTSTEFQNRAISIVVPAASNHDRATDRTSVGTVADCSEHTAQAAPSNSVKAALSSPTFTLREKEDATTGSLDDEFELLLVIAPGCDLQRCSPNYDTLCVRGKIAKSSPDLADLLGQESLFTKTHTNEFRHLLRKGSGTDRAFQVIEWVPKKIVTKKISDLFDGAKFSRIARLNEIFAQEVKEESLRQMGRIGVPVDPSFSAALGATLKLGAGKNKEFVLEAPDENFVAAIFISRNENNPVKITFSEQFLDWIDSAIATFEEETKSPLAEKIKDQLLRCRESAGEGLLLNKKGLIQDEGGFKVYFLKEFVRGKFSSPNELILYPRGRIMDDFVADEGSQIAKILSQHSETKSAFSSDCNSAQTAEAGTM